MNIGIFGGLKKPESFPLMSLITSSTLSEPVVIPTGGTPLPFRGSLGTLSMGRLWVALKMA